MSVRWITPYLGTAAFDDVAGLPDCTIIDVRDLVDKAGNSREIVAALIRQGVASLEAGRRVVVGCGYGISRSNALAVGILACRTGTHFADALRVVQAATAETEIKLSLLQAVQEAMPPSATSAASPRTTLMVTGHTGLVGRALMPRLDGDRPVFAPTRAELDVAAGPTNIYRLAEAHAVGTIIHLANPRVRATNGAIGETLTMLRNVIDVCCATHSRLIYPSSWEVYAGHAATLHADEATPRLTRGPYGEAKYLAEQLILNACQTEGLRCAILRSATLYDDRGSKPDFLRRFVAKARRSEPIATHLYHNGPAALDLLHVDDFVSAIRAAVASDVSGALNLGTGLLTGTRQIAERIVSALGSDSRITQTAIQADMALVSMDSTQAAQQLDWKPTHRFLDRLDTILDSLNPQ